MSEVFIKVLEIPAPFNVAVIAVTAGILLAMIAVISTEVRKFANHRSDNELKREMVERGLSPEEIERVLEAGRDSAQAKKK